MKRYLRVKQGGVLFLLLIALLFSVAFAVSLGSVDIPFSKVLTIILSRLPLIGSLFPFYTGSDATIVVLIRLPRVMLGVIAGLGLAVSGTSMQGIFKNPMASPYILGVSAGGAFGASVGIYFGLPYYLIPLIAFCTGMGTALMVFGLGRVKGRIHISTLLLSGLAMNFLMTALTSYVLFMSSPKERMGILAWMWGNLQGIYWEQVYIAVPVVLVGAVAVLAYSRDLNVIQTGEESAMQLGINVERTKVIQLGAASLIASTVISFTGIIGFVGLVIPHLSRLIVGPDHKILIPTSALFGGIFLVLCDTLSRLTGGIWVGVITGLVGAPFFIFLLIRKRGETGW